MTRNEFMRMTGAAVVSAGCLGPASLAAAGRPLKVRFLGTGAADWEGRDERGEDRRNSSVLLENRVLIDLTDRNLEMLPKGCRPTTVFYTHSHSDHFSPETAVRMGIRRAYVHESWVEGARQDFAGAARRLGKSMPEVVPLAFGETVREGDLSLMILPANHTTSRKGERCAMYLVEKDDVRLLYAVDTGGIMAEAARLCGIDAHIRGGNPVTAIIMEATMGVGHMDDFRIFTHSSVAMVAQTVRVLSKTGRYRPRPGQKVYITHLARTLHGTQAEITAAIPAPLAPAFDGLEVVF